MKDPPQNQGHQSRSWIQGDFLLQERPVSDLLAVERSIALLRPLQDDPLFLGARGQIIKKAPQTFQVAWPLLPGSAPSSFAELDPLLPSLAEALQKLHSLPLCRDVFLRPSSRTTSLYMSSASWVRAGLEAIAGHKIRLPREPRSAIVVAHGDLHRSNVLCAKQAYIIDWATVWALPEHADAARLIEGFLFRQDGWEEILQQSWQLAPWLEFEEWTAAVFWAAARTTLFWQSNKTVAFVEKMEQFLR